jgi:hypothetical protein
MAIAGPETALGATTLPGVEGNINLRLSVRPVAFLAVL